MTEETRTDVKARMVAEQLHRIALERGIDVMFAVVEQQLTRPEVIAALVLMVQYDARRQAGRRVRFEVDCAALDFLRGVKPDTRAVLASVHRLDEDEQREALAELVALHAELDAAELIAARQAHLN